MEHLNKEQVEAATHIGGPLMIVAGAGTGKTTMISHRIAWLVEQGHAKPENILALTFTEKAAGEMEERVDMLLPYGYIDLQISTFHSFCETLLRDYGAEIGLTRDFKMLTELDSWLLTRREFERFQLEYYRPLGNPTKYLKGLLTHFSRCKDEAISADDYLSFTEEQVTDLDTTTSNEETTTEVARIKELANAYHTYQQILLENDALDFGDLITYTLKLLRERPNVLKEIRQRFTFVLVDEFQDTNLAQFEIVKLIAAPRNEITVVGDDDQSIYRFRGASISNILSFKKSYPETKTIVLTENYRSVQKILDQAYNFIQLNNPNRLEASDNALSKKLTANRKGKGDFHHLHFFSIENEAEGVAQKIIELKKKNSELNWNDFAILTRSNDAASPFITALQRYNLPYQFLALSGLYSKSAVLDLLSYLRIINDPFDSPSMYRILTLDMHHIPPIVINKLNHLARRRGISLNQACRQISTISEIDIDHVNRVTSIMTQIDQLAIDATKQPISRLFLNLAKKISYIEFINTFEERDKQENFSFLQQFYERLRSFESHHEQPVLRNFMEEFKEERSAGEEGALTTDLEAGPDMIRVMTIHSSKGLEFCHVFIISLVNQRFPTRARREAIPLPENLSKEPNHSGNAHLEEERRLFYVAMTRAKKGLWLTSAEDYGGVRARKPSRFITEIGFEKTLKKQQPLTDIPTNPIPSTDKDLVVILPKQFSYTQLVAFQNCPLQYKFAHLYKIPVFGTWTLSFGKTMHNTLQLFFETWLERKGSQQHSLFDSVSTTPNKIQTTNKLSTNPNNESLPVSLEELLKFYQDCWQDEWYLDNKQRKKYKKIGQKSLKEYYKIIENNSPHPLHLEQGFTLKIGGITIKGRIDRIDKLEDGVEIIDYKTGEPKNEKKLNKKAKEQLLLYQLACRDVLGLKVNKLTFHYLQDNSKISFLGSDEDLLKLEESIVERISEMKNSNFKAKPGFHCGYCNFTDICEFRQKK